MIDVRSAVWTEHYDVVHINEAKPFHSLQDKVNVSLEHCTSILQTERNSEKFEQTKSCCYDGLILI